MPTGIERINARRKQPNDRITFIKPLEGPDKDHAQDFLERIAAICNPIMKKHYISVMSLEEYEPNPEFIGRNFNAGEVIQLVLKAQSGHWLPFKFVQMIMMHELSHCKQMNHSRAFYKVMDGYKAELKELWAREYTGEGLWSRGVNLSSGQWTTNQMEAGEAFPENLCGGTFRSNRKRKRKPTATYKERQARRIAKKFGIAGEGMALGADETMKAKLENGKKPPGKPRVAGSNRGRDLRAAAALARFEVKKEPAMEADGEDTESASETESGDDDEDGPMEIDAVDINGMKLLDGKGRGMVKVCGDTDVDDKDARDEREELEHYAKRTENGNVYGTTPVPSTSNTTNSKGLNPASDATNLSSKSPYRTREVKDKYSKRAGDTYENSQSKGRPSKFMTSASTSKPQIIDQGDISTASEDDATEPIKPPGPKLNSRHKIQLTKPLAAVPVSDAEKLEAGHLRPISCPVCSMENIPLSTLCMACSNVLDTETVSDTWRCGKEVCKGSKYINAGDFGVVESVAAGDTLQALKWALLKMTT